MILNNPTARAVTVNPPKYLNSPTFVVPAGSTATAPDYLWEIMEVGLSSLGLTASFGGGTGGAPIVPIINNWNATTAPLATDDSTAGYAAESRWYDNSGHDLYVCVSAVAAAAVWHLVSNDVLNALNATATPSASNDVTQGYTAGSVWIDTTTAQVFTCVSSTAGAAVWANQTTAVAPASSFDKIVITATVLAGTPITANTVPLGATAAAFNGNAVVIQLNGFEQVKATDVTWVSSTTFAISVDMYAGDIAIVKP